MDKMRIQVLSQSGGCVGGGGGGGGGGGRGGANERGFEGDRWNKLREESEGAYGIKIAAYVWERDLVDDLCICKGRNIYY